MKNIRIIKETLRKIKGKGLAIVTAGIMMLSGQQVSAEGSNKVTAQELVNAMITGNKITVEMPEEEVDKLERQAEEAIEKAGASLLPVELEEIYNSLKNLTGEKRTKQLAIVAGLCDTFLIDGTAELMTYPEAIQFAGVCEKVCGELIKDGNKAIYSIKQSEQLGEEIYTGLEDIIKQAQTNRELKKETYITAIKTDLGYYDDCFLGKEDQNMPTGEKEDKTVKNILLVSSVLASSGMLLSAFDKKKEEKGKTYQKRR